MRLLLIEFITGGGCLGASLPTTLAEEGDFMLSAVLRDAQSVPGHVVVVPRDVRLAAPSFPCEVLPVIDDAWQTWRKAVKQADCVLAIAPEIDGALERLNAMILSEDGDLLGCSPQAVRVTASKLQTCGWLRDASIANVPTVTAEAALPGSDRGWVVKPDDGAGSEHTWHVNSEQRVREISEAVPNAVVQPFIDGDALSLSVLCSHGEAVLLACNRQIVDTDGAKLRQAGVEVNGAVEYFEQMQSLVRRVVAGIPGLQGFIGIDLIMTTTGPVILEINPRLTTAYAGISESIGANALQLLLEVCLGDMTSVAKRSLTRKPVTVMPHAD